MLAVAEVSPGVADTHVLAEADRTRAVLLTEDKDFGELVYRRGAARRGVVLLRLAGLSRDVRAALVSQAFNGHGAEFVAHLPWSHRLASASVPPHRRLAEPSRDPPLVPYPRFSLSHHHDHILRVVRLRRPAQRLDLRSRTSPHSGMNSTWSCLQVDEIVQPAPQPHKVGSATSDTKTPNTACGTPKSSHAVATLRRRFGSLMS